MLYYDPDYDRYLGGRPAMRLEAARLRGRPGSWDFLTGRDESNLLVTCPGNAGTVMARAKQILLAIDRHGSGSRWPSLRQWKRLLPAFAVRQHIGIRKTVWALSLAGAGFMSRLTRDELIDLYRREQWTLRDWLDRFRPDRRDWIWWYGRVIDPDTLAVTCEGFRSTADQPRPEHAWLFKLAGALLVDDMLSQQLEEYDPHVPQAKYRIDNWYQHCLYPAFDDRNRRNRR